MNSLIFPRAVSAAAAGAIPPGELRQILRGTLAHLIIQGAYIYEFAQMDIVCERRLWHLTDQETPSETISILADALSAALKTGTARPARQLDFQLYILEEISVDPAHPTSRKRFDIANFTLNQVFEIKPNSVNRIEEGRRYLTSRIDAYESYRLAMPPVPPITRGIWNPPRLIPSGLKSVLECQLAEPGLIVYRFRDRDDDETIESLRAAIRHQQFENDLLFYAGVTLALIAAGYVAGSAIGLILAERAAVSVAAAAAEGAGTLLRLSPLLREGGRVGAAVAGTQGMRAAASPGAANMPSQKDRPRPFRVPWTDPLAPARKAPGSVESRDSGGLPPESQNGGATDAQSTDSSLMRASQPPLTTSDETLPGGTPPLPAELEAAQIANLLAGELMFTFPDALARDEEMPALTAARRTALAAMLNSVLLSVGVLPGLTALAGPDIRIDPARLTDPVQLNAIALRIVRSFAARSLAIADWLTFAPDAELVDMLAYDAHENS